mmetsp:Transcript_19145/g.53862  ORF Transcript_19145/g.53862 Transcript_19145/m.53862 type:complete len:221 (-) Transcript_19145:92-754(-)
MASRRSSSCACVGAPPPHGRPSSGASPRDPAATRGSAARGSSVGRTSRLERPCGSLGHPTMPRRSSRSTKRCPAWSGSSGRSWCPRGGRRRCAPPSSAATAPWRATRRCASRARRAPGTPRRQRSVEARRLFPSKARPRSLGGLAMWQSRARRRGGSPAARLGDRSARGGSEPLALARAVLPSCPPRPESCRLAQLPLRSSPDELTHPVLLGVAPRSNPG